MNRNIRFSWSDAHEGDLGVRRRDRLGVDDPFATAVAAAGDVPAELDGGPSRD
jgi:hypothetical protein